MCMVRSLSVYVIIISHKQYSDLAQIKPISAAHKRLKTRHFHFKVFI